MNAKFVFAVLIALQVSLALCDIPQPDQDVVEKYDEYKATLKRRFENLYNRAKILVSTEQTTGAVEKADRGVALLKIVAQEISPMLDNARTNALGVYSGYMRPYIGPFLQKAIDQIKAVLDQIAPADQQS